MFSLGLPVITPLPLLLARRPGLAPFSTAGFQDLKPAPVKSRQEVVHVSSDSGPPTPGPNGIKRDSSGFSVVDEPYPYPLKRQKTEEKENVLGTSVKINNSSTAASHLPHEDERHTDLASVSITNISNAAMHF